MTLSIAPNWPRVPEEALEMCRTLRALGYSPKAVARWARGRYPQLAGVPVARVDRATRRRRGAAGRAR